MYFSLGFISYARAELKSNSNELANDLFLAKVSSAVSDRIQFKIFAFLFFKDVLFKLSRSFISFDVYFFG